MSKVLSALDIVSQYLQSKQAELQLAVDYLAKTEQLSKRCLRTVINSMKSKMKLLLFVLLGVYILEKFEQKRVCKIKRHFGELLEDNHLNSPEDAFRVNVFYVTIDTVLAQLHQRFIATKEITAKFSILNPLF